MNKREKWILAGGLALAALLRFVSIGMTDLSGDGAINSFRALGWFDWLGYSGQSTPFEWLGFIPGWAELSFHDAPPLVFYIQHLFFTVFGSGVVAARLPFALAGIASVWLVYLFLRNVSGEVSDGEERGQVSAMRWVAPLGAVLAATLSYTIWAEHSAYLEGMEALFIVGAVVFGGLFMYAGHVRKYMYLWIIFIALALISKYTALFLIPPTLIYLWLSRKDVWSQKKHFFVALGISFLLVLPVVIYNANMFALRGHFDAALSSIVGMHPEDFKIISDRAPSGDIIGNAIGFFATLAQNISYPLMVLAGASLLMLVWRLRTTGWRTPEAWVLTNAFFLLVLFSFAGSADRFLPIAAPFVVLVTALGVPRVMEKLANPAVRRGFAILVILIVVFELVYSVNTNVLREPVGRPGWLYASAKLESKGFNQLESYLRDEAIKPLPKMRAVRAKADTVLTNEDIEGRSVVVYDDRIDWFSQMWYMQKFFLYYRWPVISTSFLAGMGEGDTGLKALLEASGKPAYFVYPVGAGTMDKTRATEAALNVAGPTMSRRLDAAGAPVHTIETASGKPAFRVYRINSI